MDDSLPNRLQDQKACITNLIKELNNRLCSYPDGSLRIARKRGKYQYYRRDSAEDIKGTYIPRKDHASAVMLAQKDYDIKLLAVLEKQLTTIDRFLSTYNPDSIQQVYSKLSDPRKALVDKGYLTDEEFAAQWQTVPYRKLGFNKEDPEYFTRRGERVRSKSEILIADALYSHNIPYRYEYPLYIGNVLVAAPDFNCLNVRLRREYYWEHLGMMGNKEYANHNVKKLECYSLAPDFDESRLILTFETESHPINTKVIEEKIRKFLL